MKITVRISKRIQEKQYEPLEIEVAASKEIPSPTALRGEMKDLSKELDGILDELFLARTNGRRNSR